MNKELLKEYLSGRYQGWSSFLDNVIFPIFGQEDFEDGFEAELLDSQPERRQLAQATGIHSMKQVGKIYVGVEPLQIFDVTVSDRVMMERNRVNIQRLVRTVMDQFSCAFMLFHYEDDTRWDWRFTYCRKSGNKEESTDSKRYTFLLGPGQSCRTATDNFMGLYDKRDSLEIKDIEDAFNVEALSKEFFGKYKAQYEAFVSYMIKPDNGMRQNFIDTDFDHTGMTADKIRDREEKPIRDYVKKLFGRIVFLHFLQKKGWLGVPAGKEWGEGDHNFMLHLFENASEEQKENFLDDILEDLFAKGLDCNRSDRGDLYDTKVEGFRNHRIPYLNGGLFERDNLDEKTVCFPSNYFKDLLTMLSQYNFTIDENDPNDAEVGVDPEMLGRIFENLLEDNKDKGAFYTPKEIVQYMCRESLIAYLQTDQREEDKEPIRQFVTTHDVESLGELKEEIEQKLIEVKICDPAIGSGAFPMGLLRELFLCRSAIELNIVEKAADIKRHIIQNNIYGVDIERGAVEIARLRFWLALIVEEKSPEVLPNLDFKIMQGNSLLEQYKGVDLSTMTENKLKSGQVMTIFDNMLEDYRKKLRDKLAEYYACPAHDKKVQLRRDIVDIVKQQLIEQHIYIDFENLDLSANSQFFLWHTWFHDVFSRPSKEGFDIVIGNPPYISTKGVTIEDKRKYEKEFGFSDDTYNLFTFKGMSLLKDGGSLSYIIPKTFWTTQTKRNMRDLILSNQINYIFDTTNPFDAVMVDTCIIQVVKHSMPKEHLIRFMDGTKDLSNPLIFPPIKQDIYLDTQNSVIFKPTDLNLRIYQLYGHKVKELYEKWWDKIETSRKIAKNQQELEAYRASLKPGDVALLGCLTEGGQGLATANNGKYIAVRRSTKLAKNIISSRPKKLAEAIKKKKVSIPQMANFANENDFLDSLSEKEIATLFDSLKEQYGRDIFDKGYIYKIIEDSELANVDELSEEEKENGIDTSKNYYVPYDKGDKEGNRWYLETPFAIAWSKENVQFLKTNSGKKGEGMPVVRNPQFYFREGFCWIDVNSTYLKARIKSNGVFDVLSMSLFTITELPDWYYVSLINSEFISLYVDNFINNTSHFQINDARQLPVIIPTQEELCDLQRIVQQAIDLKKHSFSPSLNISVEEKKLEEIQCLLNQKVLTLYRI
ncbi:restriction endonuclease [Capnocytophaga gingivalis]|uniref:site-specific DNA-methyltransferase (adenine-specific) n=1 Tax=Capnocytophaga gingivalis TaxID=1017 RepID=A0A250FNR1_9FLAO|nr:DNA methyltransferase [Capnocytophaga gingivalis]ATA86661.1 restriction endonuclease [Capnocytophaga gingivalis]